MEGETERKCTNSLSRFFHLEIDAVQQQKVFLQKFKEPACFPSYNHISPVEDCTTRI